MRNAAEMIGWFILALVIVAVLGFIFALPVKWLWNWLVPELFGLPSITYLQGFGLYLLFALLVHRPSGSKSGGSE